MGKQAKKRRQLAVTLASQPHPAPQATPKGIPKRQPAKPKLPPKTAANTDMLTGNYLDARLPRWYLDGDNSRPEHVRAPIPSRIHTRQEATSDSERTPDGRRLGKREQAASRETLGSHEWAPEFARYMKPVLPRIVAEEQSLWLAWWDIEYVRGRLMKRLGQTTVMVTLAALRDGDDTAQIARDWQHSQEWVRRQISLTVKMAATYFTPR